MPARGRAEYLCLERLMYEYGTMVHIYGQAELIDATDLEGVRPVDQIAAARSIACWPPVCALAPRASSTRCGSPTLRARPTLTRTSSAKNCSGMRSCLLRALFAAGILAAQVVHAPPRP